ncbi:hypothetical protein ABB37_02756 [Leptomonas pyrrhocoris]|uniref:Uncharacterized protein n=1 Tax=Leptomonas pyrrhocoris TaxID=157538 RepID=A0A0N0DXI6_LEPPY|nr:hypothetical protein ABB37_02756 [Leptomonas pyrrhocoris]KPA83028.1 hypothetical protein ABB37_02756 [Leptomonas pyrrhocoris]|eukprot:XP_015661467.1 hypothetical protein ABB37_02756 [Leptomonas pyrrhocoris]
MQNISSYNVYGAGRPVQASPRKSVRFVSPDKLENVTPTKVVIFADAESSCSEEEVEESEEEEEEEEEAARTSVHRPPSKKARVETSQSTTPKRDSVVLPPAPPPSAVKSPSGKHGDCSPGSRSSSTSPPSPSGASQRTHSPDSSPRVSHGSRTSASSRSSSAESPQSARTYTMHHDELKAYVMQHTIRQSLACLTKREMKVFLKEEGSSLATQHHVLKKHLLTEIRALIRKQAEA